MIYRILLVCTGNICRSPMGEAVFVKALEEVGRSEVEVRSAGLGALVGHPADDTAQRLLRAQGVDISNHRARQLTSDLINWADLILVMDREQKTIVESLAPIARGKVYRLGEWSDMDIPDPYLQSEDVFEGTLNLVEKEVSVWINKLAG